VRREAKPSLEAKSNAAESGKKIFSKSAMGYTAEDSIEAQD
jgi:hypothetical protein